MVEWVGADEKRGYRSSLAVWSKSKGDKEMAHATSRSESDGFARLGGRRSAGGLLLLIFEGMIKDAADGERVASSREMGERDDQVE